MEQSYFLPNGLRRGSRYDSVFFGAYAGETATFDIRVRFDLKRRFNAARFQRAADAALFAYPEFAVRPVLCGGRILYAENRAPIKLVPDDGRRLCFGTEDTNGYLFVFLTGERHVTLSLFHGLTDARGMIAYVVSVMWKYAKECFPPIALLGVKSLEKHGIRMDRRFYERMDDTERFDPVAKFAGPGEAVDLIDVERLFRMPPERFDRADPTCRLLNLEVSNEAFLRKTKALGTSFAPLLAALTARAIAGLYEIGDRVISVVATADARRFFPTYSVGNMAYNCPLPVSKEDLALPLAELCAKIRGDMLKQTTRENAAAAFSSILATCAEIDAMGDVDAVSRALNAPGGLETLTTNGTLFLTYPGRVANNPISRLLLKGVTPGMLAVERAVVAYAHRETLVIQITQKSDDHALVNALRGALAAEGLASELRDMGRVTQNVFSYERIERAEPPAEGSVT